MRPTTPQGVIAFYAANKLGAVAALIHPLSSSEEIGQALDATGARIALTLDAFYPALAAARPRLALHHIILARIGDSLSPLKRLLFWWRKGRAMAAIPPDRKRVESGKRVSGRVATGDRPCINKTKQHNT